MTNILPANGDAAFGIGDRTINIREGADAPTAFVVFGDLQFGPRGAQMLKRPVHVRLAPEG